MKSVGEGEFMFKIGQRAIVVSDNEYGDGGDDIGIDFIIEGLREGSGGKLVLVTGAATRGFDGFYANRCVPIGGDSMERKEDE